MGKWIWAGLLVLMAALIEPAFSQDIAEPEYENFIRDTMSASKVPGLAVVLFDETGISYEKAFGVVDNASTPATLDTPFQLGSVSKSFAALLAVQLADEGQLELDGRVIDTLPYFRTADADRWRDITVRHVLSHRSGFSTLDGNRLQDDDDRGADAIERAVKTLANVKLISAPGQRYEYSNANYHIVAALIETVTGRSFETAMEERIFKPLGMAHSYVQMSTKVTPTESMGFRQWFGVPVAQRHIPGRAWMAAGGVTTSARDLATYLRAMANRDPRIVPSAFADDLITAQGDESESEWGYGLGWMLIDIENRDVVYHSGLNGGFATHVAFFPDEKTGGLVLTNQSGSLQADVAGAVLRKGLGIATGATRPAAGQHLMIWGMLLTVAALAFSFVLSTVRFSAYANSVKRVNVFRRVVPALGLFALAFFLAFTVPRMNGVTLSGVKVFYPDLWLCLALSALISVLWGVTRLVYPRAKRD